jgi:flagellar P-ring protein FlgI
MEGSMRYLFTLCTFLVCFSAATAQAARVEELCDVRGARPNQLIGYGLVVGLNNTGDTGQARFTVQSTAAMLRRLGATVDQRSIQTRNAAAVMVTATLPPFSAPGVRVDVTVSSLGNARSLFGGTLLQTALFGADKRVYAVAQGPVMTGGFAVSGGTGSSVTKNHTTAGRVPEGAIVERDVPTSAMQDGIVTLSLRDPNFVNATRIAQAIDTAIGQGSARALDGGRVEIKAPKQFDGNTVGLLATISLVEVETDSSARVVIDERTGTIVVGSAVRISEVAIAQGGLTIEVQERFNVSQPSPFTINSGTTQVTPQTNINVDQGSAALTHVKASATLKELVDALNAVGARPRELISIFQALRSAGAISARIEVQ